VANLLAKICTQNGFQGHPLVAASVPEASGEGELSTRYSGRTQGF